MESFIMDYLAFVICGAIYLVILGVANLKKPKEE